MIEYAVFQPCDPCQAIEGELEKVFIGFDLYFDSVKKGIEIIYKKLGEKEKSLFIDFIVADEKHVNIIEVSENQDKEAILKHFNLVSFILRQTHWFDRKKGVFNRKNVDKRKIRAIYVGKDGKTSFSIESLYKCENKIQIQSLIDSKNQFWESKN